MATIVLSAVGAAAGASVGGGVLGLSSVVLGRAAGAIVGRVIDQKLLGSGSQAVETGRMDRLRLTGASEGASIAQVYGRMRIAGQVIWATKFKESVRKSGGSGKGVGSRQSISEYSYSISLAIALCEGAITGIGRIWADGVEIAPADLNLRVYHGTENQIPDPKIEAVEGAGHAPAYRGIAYVVIEDLELSAFGNRVPQLTFEVFRPGQASSEAGDIASVVNAVAIIPGTGEYALATTPVYVESAPGETICANVNTPAGRTDFSVSMDALNQELPNCGSTSLVVSWFGNDLRCGACEIAPKVEQTKADGKAMPWHVSGQNRFGAEEIPRDSNGNSIYGGTPSDQSVVEAIEVLNAAGKKVLFYPFILMEQLSTNELPDPYTGNTGQPALPWRGRITTSLAPGVNGSSDGTAAADAEVAAFFGQAAPGDFVADAGTVQYLGPQEWSFRRMILHYAHLCVQAGGVDAFCIGSEMRGLTQIRGAGGFPAVDQLVQLAADVRSIVGPNCKISYAADWSEYFGYRPQDGSGDVLFHLDPLWADPNIDFIGIDNYMPLTDWRDGDDHADAHFGSIYDLDYLKSGIEGAEGYDWYYAASEHREAQIRTPIGDGAFGEDWVWRYKDIRNWWTNTHHNRVSGVRSETPTDWVPQSKPFWFTELGCAAIDKGPNEPNKFLDPKSSESALPRYSNGRRDDFVQMQYLRAITEYWSDPAKNPWSTEFEGQMIDMTRAHVWAWDARPYPYFPGNTEKWSDGGNYARGHWLNGRTSARSLADVVREVCLRAGLSDERIDTSRLFGLVRGYSVTDVSSARATLQPLMLTYGFEAIERGGKIIFRNRTGLASETLDTGLMADSSEIGSSMQLVRAPNAEMAGRVQLTFVDADGDYGARSEEAIFPDELDLGTESSELPIALTRSEGKSIAERWLNEARIARDTIRLALPLSRSRIGAGDTVAIDNGTGPSLYRIDHTTMADAMMVEAVRVERETYTPSDATDEFPSVRAFVTPLPVMPIFLDLPLLSGDEVPHAPHIAAAARPWPGSAAVYSAASDVGYTLNRLLPASATIGVLESPLFKAGSGAWDRSAPCRIRLISGELASVDPEAVLNGANLAAIGNGASDNWEIIQFAHANLVGERTYEISMRLRGQAGTDALDAEWPAGSYFVLLDGAPQQIDLASSVRGLARHYRIGPSQRGYDDPSYEHLIEAFQGIGLRPFAPAHLTTRPTATGDLEVNWIRRTRIDGDSWQSIDVPLGEESESYRIRVVKNGAVLREVDNAAPNWTYPQTQQTSDGATAPFGIEVAQISAAFGPGLYTRIEIND